MPKEARDKALNELKKLKMMSPMSAEATVVRNYIDTIVGLPWKKKSKVNNDLTNAEKVLEDEHYGLDKVKERILEYLAVQQRVDKLKAPILCLVGLRVSVKRLSVSRLPGQQIASSFAWRLVVCVTRQRFVDIVALTLAPCLAKFCRAWPRSVFATLFFVG
jgi:hypothetical protein